jgi:transcriptional regulator GlxA family with amidase domain
MKVTSYAPSERLAPFVREFTIVEADEETTRVLIPDTALLLGIRFSGSATQLSSVAPDRLPDATIAGLQQTARHIRTSAGGGIVLAAFREGSAAQFLGQPLHELHAQTRALDDLMPHAAIDTVQSRIAEAADHAQRVAIFEEFLLARRQPRTPDPVMDPVMAEAVSILRRTHGSVRIGALGRYLGLSRDPLEKRFRRAVGASPKQYASILRLRYVVAALQSGASLTRASIDAGYFDQAHFNRHFRSVTGDAPLRFFGGGTYC